MGRGKSSIKKRKKHVSILEGDTSRKKQKFKIAVAQADVDDFLNEGA